MRDELLKEVMELSKEEQADLIGQLLPSVCNQAGMERVAQRVMSWVQEGHKSVQHQVFLFLMYSLKNIGTWKAHDMRNKWAINCSRQLYKYFERLG